MSTTTTGPRPATSRPALSPTHHRTTGRIDRLRESWLRVRSLLRKEFRQTFRDPRTRLLVLGAPVVQLLMFGYAVNTDVREVATFVVDHDATATSRALLDALTASGYFQIVGRSDRHGELTRALDAGRATVGVEIPSGFARDLAAGRGATVQVVVDGSNSNTGTVAQGYIGRIVQHLGAEAANNGDAGLATGIDLRARAWFNPELASRLYNVPAVIGMILMLMAFLLTALAVVRERELGTLDQLTVTPITPGEMILGKTIPVAIIAFIDLALITAVAVLWFEVPFRGSALALLIASGLFILASLGAGLLISTISRTQQEAFMTMFLVLLPLIILSGFMYPVDTMPAFFQVLTRFNPARHFLEVVRTVFLKGAGFAEVRGQLVTLSAMAGTVFGIAVWRFRRSLG